MPASVAAPRIADDANAAARLCPLASISDATVNPSGILCRKIATKITPPSQVETSKPGRNRHAVEKRVDHQAEQRRITRVRVRNLLVMRFFAKMKMRREGVLEKMHQEIAREDEHENRVGVVEKIPSRESLRSFTDSGIISIIAVASMNPAPSAMKYFR